LYYNSFYYPVVPRIPREDNVEILTVQGAADLLGVDTKTIYRLIDRDGLPAFKVGRQWRMRLSDIERWIDVQVRVGEPAGTYRLAQQPLLRDPETPDGGAKPGFSDSAFTENGDLPIHRWVPWIAGFSATFVAEVLDHYAGELGGPAACPVLDPFAGVGTTPVTALLRGHRVYGFEINPYAAEAARLKLNVHSIPLGELERLTHEFEKQAQEEVRAGTRPKSQPPAGFRTRRAFLSPEVERKVLLVTDFMDSINDSLVKSCFRVALASELVGFSNYSYEPSLGTRAAAGKSEVTDAPVVATIVKKLRLMTADARLVQTDWATRGAPPVASFHEGSFFELHDSIPDGDVGLVVTSPPYLNNYHYIRNSRPQVYWLGLAQSPQDLKGVEQGSFGKFWQTVRGDEPITLDFPMEDLEQSLAFLRTINTHKAEYGGGGWANYAAVYFNDCFRFAGILRRILADGGRAIVVLGNSILQGVEFRTDEVFAEICGLQGLRTDDIHALREKRTGTSIIQSSVRVNAAKSKTRLYESAVVVAKQA
jgi:excisionase family DNA binding protein